MKHIFTLFILLITATALWAVPAQRGIIKVTQKDGTVLTLQLVGDENLHYYLNTETGEKMQKGNDGDYYVISEEDFQEMQSEADIRQEQNNARRKARLAPKKTLGKFGNMTGDKKGLVILVNFSDVSMTTGTQSEFDAMFNKEGYNSNNHIGSVADYFKDQSYDKFLLSFDVVGPVTLSQNMAYYGGNSSGSDQHPGEMVKEACELVDNLVDSQEKPLVDFGDYDWDSNGEVDQVFVIYAGYGENWSGSDPNTIWPHEWTLQDAIKSTLSLDGVKINTYACTSELAGTAEINKSGRLNGIGTACHEFSHCLGYPDFYDTDYSGGQGMEYYDVMCSGNYNGYNGIGEVPAGFSAYERWMAGWLTPIVPAGNVTNMADLGSTASAYIIYNNNNANEYFLLENRQSSKWFSYYGTQTAGHGLLITHVDYDSGVWSNNKPNDDPEQQRMTWVPADKSYGTYDTENKSWSQTEAEQQSDFFPGSSNTSFAPTEWSEAGGKWFNKDKNDTFFSDLCLSNIAETDGKISFNINGTQVNVSSAGYSTYYDSASSYTMPEGMMGYIFNSTSKKIEKTYESGTIVPAEEALVLKADAGIYTLKYATTQAIKSADNALLGTDEATALTADDNCYFYALSLNSAGETSSIGFYWMKENGAAFTNGAHKAYLKLAKSGNAKVGYPFNDDEADGINSISTEFNRNAPVYNLSGQRVSPTTKGILIQNGKKFINK